MSNLEINKRRLLKLGATLAAGAPFAAVSATAAHAAGDDAADASGSRLPTDVVYINGNIADGGNAVLGFRRAKDGSLTPLPGSPYATGGTGYFVANFGLGPFDGDQEIVIDRLRGVLYAVNAGSNSVSAFRIARSGVLTPLAGSPFATPGQTPVSIGLHSSSLLVLNSAQNPAVPAGSTPSAVLAAITGDTGTLAAVPSSAASLPTGSGPTQALTAFSGPFTFVCDFLGGTVASYVSVAFGSYATLRQIDQVTPPQQAGATSVPSPLGLWASPLAPVLYVGFATTNQLGVYRFDELGQLTFLRTATNSGDAICWLRTGLGGRRLFTIDTGNNSVSVYNTADPEQPFEIQNLVVAGLAGRLVQFDITPDDRYLYCLERATTPAIDTAQGTPLHVFAVDPETGRLTYLPAATIRLPVPNNTIPFGVVTL